MLVMNKKTRFYQNPYLLFVPFLVIYILIVLRFHNDLNVGDEGRYMLFAQRLLNGSYSPPFPNIDLTNGPGYPIVLMPFIGFNLPLIYISLLNAIFYYLSIIFLFKSLRQIASYQVSVIVSLFWACYYNAYEYLSVTVSETFTLFLISLLVFSLMKAFNPNISKKAKYYLVLSGLTLGYIVLTKFIFSYVLLIMLAGTGILWILNRSNTNYRKGVIIMVIGLATNIPYLFYTNHLTGKLLYWGSAGGDSMYWMSSPYKNEYGDWQSFNAILKNSRSNDECIYKNDSLLSNHGDVIREISKYNNIERDEILEKIAIKNITTYPIKYLQNCISNVGRILFNYPYSYTPQKPVTLFRISLNGIIVVLILFCMIPTLINWRKIIYPLRIMLFVALLYFGGSILGSAETRMFTVIVPILLVWITCIVQGTINVSLKWIGNKREL